MGKKILSVMVVAIMAFASIVALIPDDSEATASAPTTVNPIPGNNMPWVSLVAVPYYNSLNMYFTEDPYDEIVKFVNGEQTLAELKTKCGYSDTTPPGSYYYVYYYSGNSYINCTYYDRRAIEIIPSFDGYFSENPYSEVAKWANREITVDELKTKCGYDPSSGKYHVTYSKGSSSVWIYDKDLGTYNYVYLSSRYQIYNLYFKQDPYTEVLRYVNGEIDLDELKTKCGYSDNPNWDEQWYNVSYEYSGNINISRSSNRNIDAGILAISGEGYFTTNPYVGVVKYINDEINMASLKATYGFVKKSLLVEGTSYYNVSMSGNNGNGYMDDRISKYVRTIDVQPDYIFLEKGEYHINVTDTDLTSIRINGLNKNSRYNESISISDRSGSADIKVSSQDAIWFTDNYNSDSSFEKNWKEKVITFTIDPAPSQGEKITTFDKTVKILPDKEWVRLTTVKSLTGTYSCESGYIMFRTGSAEENEFIKNVIEKGLIDASGYGDKTLKLNGEKVTLYSCRESSSSIPGYAYLETYSEEKSYYHSERCECKAEKMSVSDVEPYKFYANYDFSIAVKYDTSKVKAVVMMYPNGLGGTEYSVLESERKYNFSMISSAEYELFAVPVTTVNTTLQPVEIGIYTENVASPDSNGLIFAAVAIVLCVMAFGILFMSGHRPKWNEATGLPSGDTEIVQNEVPEEPPKD